MRFAFKGPCSIHTGYANLFRSLVQHLSGRVELEVLALDNKVSEGCPLTVCQRPLVTRCGLLLGFPTNIFQLGTQYRILYSMCEVSDLPDDWQRDLRYADEVWVPTTFCAEVFGSYHPRVRIVPVGYDEQVFMRQSWSPSDRDNFWLAVCPEASGKRVFGTAGVMSLRKGVDVLLRAWEVASLDDSALIIKTRDTKGVIRSGQNVHVIDDEWTDEHMADFYRSLDLFLLPSRGEGLGLCPLESAACGTPALVTRASGPAEYIDDRGIYGLEVLGSRRAENVQARRADWFEPDLRRLVDILRGFCQNGLAVEHSYRRRSMAAFVDRWVSEVEAALRRSEGGSEQPHGQIARGYRV